MLKNIFIFILCLLPWFVSSIIPVDYSYFNSLILPFFTPPQLFYSIVWIIIYILIAGSVSFILRKYKFSDIPLSYKITLSINYIFNQSFTLLFFGFQNNFLGFISCLGTFISCLFLYQETFQLEEKGTKFLDPYVLFSLFVTILSLTIYIMNTL